MRTIQVMFDTLTRKFLPNYGNEWVSAPNFRRLEEHCVRFDNFYAGSLPCMPARRELHTGKYNFLRRSWGPLEPFDRSVYEELRRGGVYTHLVPDHSHYWEDGGATYHNRYDTWEGFRGQEGDRWTPHDIPADMPAERNALNKKGLSVQQHYRNRTRQSTQPEMSGSRTFSAGLAFLEEHADRGNWFVQIEAFDPHEPFYVPQKFRKMYGLPDEETLNWPRYGKVPGDDDYREDLACAQKEYAALLSMCDENLGRVLDFMDERSMWKDTALIVNTDHGFLLGEHELLGKNFPPVYDEIGHLPFFIHVPGLAEGGVCDALCGTVDMAPTLLELFGCDASGLGKTDGRSILAVLRGESKGHDHLLLGMHGSLTCWTDGHTMLMKAPENEDTVTAYEYTMMPTNIRGYFAADQLQAAEMVQGCRFTNGLPCMRMPMKVFFPAGPFGTRLYDLEADPDEKNNLWPDADTALWTAKLRAALEEADAPEEEYLRLGL